MLIRHIAVLCAMLASCAWVSIPALASEDSGTRAALAAAATDSDSRGRGAKRLAAHPLAGAIAAVAAISGRVTDEESGAALEGQRVGAFRHTATGYEYESSVYTASDGTYSIPLSPSGPQAYAVRTSSPWDVWWHVHEAWQDRPCVAPHLSSVDSCIGFTPINVGPGDFVSGIDFALSRGGTISGHVVNALSNELVQGATIALLDEDKAVIESVRSGTDGRFEFRRLFEGTYFAHAYATDHRPELFQDLECPGPTRCNAFDGTPIVMTRDADVRVDFSLTPDAYIDVDLRLDGQPAACLFSTECVALVRTDGLPTPINARVLEAGGIRLGPLLPGNYLLRGRMDRRTYGQWYPGVDCNTDCVDERAQAVPITISDGNSRPRVEMDLRSLHPLTGRVTDAEDGSPIAGAKIRLFEGSAPSAEYTATSDDLGHYRLPRVDTGNYRVHADATRYFDQFHPDVECEARFPTQAACGATAQSVEFSLERGAQNLDFALSRTPLVTGRLTSRGMPISQGIHDRTVSLRFGQFADVTADFEFDATTSRYVVSDFPRGTYVVIADVIGFRSQLADERNCNLADECPWELARTYDLTSDDATIDFDLQTRGYHVLVRDLRGNPLANIALDVWNGKGMRLAAATTDALGRALLTAGPPESVGWQPEVRLSTDNDQGFVDQVYPHISCPEGTSVFRGGCTLDGAEALPFPSSTPESPTIHFSLGDGVLTLKDGFE